MEAHRAIRISFFWSGSLGLVGRWSRGWVGILGGIILHTVVVRNEQLITSKCQRINLLMVGNHGDPRGRMGFGFLRWPMGPVGIL